MIRTLLLVDDDAETLTLLSRFFERRGWQVQRAAEAAGALSLYERERPDVVLLDVDLPDLDGLRVLDVLRTRDADATVLMLTGHAEIETAVEAMRLGAENFMTKPVDLAHVEAAVDRAWEKAELRRRTRYMAERQGLGAGTEALGGSAVMREVARRVELAAGTGATVLVTGEAGTGKGFVAQLLHTMSGRRTRSFVEVNCGGVSAPSLDVELFGRERGASRDSGQRKRGLFEVADGGTVYLDEVGDLGPELQPKLLQVLEARRFRRIGGTREFEVDVRLVASTNRDLEAEVRGGRFREDLYHRLNAVPLKLPPLRDRGREEIAKLATRVLGELRRKLGGGPVSIGPDAIAILVEYPWPGNVRELRNVLERVILVSGDAEEVRPAHLPREIRDGDGVRSGSAEAELSLADVERRHIARVLTHHAGNRSRTARTLGISRATLYEKLARYGLDDVGRSRGHRAPR